MCGSLAVFLLFHTRTEVRMAQPGPDDQGQRSVDLQRSQDRAGGVPALGDHSAYPRSHVEGQCGPINPQLGVCHHARDSAQNLLSCPG